MAATAKPSTRNTTAEVAYLTRALKAPTLREALPRLAERARAESWTHEEFLVTCLQREVAARESHGGEGRIRAARFTARKSLEEFDFDHARGLKRDTIAHLGTLDFITAKDNVVFLGPPGTGKPIWPSDWRSAPAKPDTAFCSTPPPYGSPWKEICRSSRCFRPRRRVLGSVGRARRSRLDPEGRPRSGRRAFEGGPRLTLIVAPGDHRAPANRYP
jgi:hypothetical protein